MPARKQAKFEPMPKMDWSDWERNGVIIERNYVYTKLQRERDDDYRVKLAIQALAERKPTLKAIAAESSLSVSRVRAAMERIREYGGYYKSPAGFLERESRLRERA